MFSAETLSVCASRPLHNEVPAARWRVSGYRPEHAATWNAFVRKARNGVFLFERDYLGYHADRFDDASLMLWRGDELRALLPAHRSGADIVSHGGLSFGGLVLHPGTGAQETLSLIDRVSDALLEQQARRLVYKPLPHIFHRQPSEDDLYALHRRGARAVRMDLSTTIDLARRPAFAKGRRHALSKAKRAGITVRSSSDLAAYWSLLGVVLDERHGATPTHTLCEITLLAKRFAQIQLFGAYAGDTLLAGALVYRYDGVLHTQYLASSSAGREDGALDAVIAHLIDEASDGCRWLSFGISTTDQGRELNAGLAAQKEMFGGRSTVLQTLELEL
ncbi:MAG: GNAT family N-acetyltransferase [Burkholderiaceae bacterium]|nr:GNAT family N-acetyltransferase [Burkholderiaceae bacterium]